jgi:hypothetical protein
MPNHEASLESMYAYTVEGKEGDGMSTGRLLTVCPSLAAVCRYLRRWNMRPFHVHVCGWKRGVEEGGWVIPTAEVQAMMLKGESTKS